MPKLTRNILTHPLFISLLLSIVLHLSVLRVLGSLYFNESRNSISFSTPNKFSVAFAPNKSAKEIIAAQNTELKTTPTPADSGSKYIASEKLPKATPQKIAHKALHKEIPPTHSTQSRQTVASGSEGDQEKESVSQEKISESPSQAPSTATSNITDSSDSNTNKQIKNEPDARSTVFIQNVEYLEMKKPKYPPLAKRLRQEGTVELLVLIDVEGLPKLLKIQESSEYAILDKAAIKAVKKWRFKPHIVGKKSVEAWAIVPIDFDLRQAQR
ncbi:MAG: energy transducer TonB [Agarilytica sp.]